MHSKHFMFMHAIIVTLCLLAYNQLRSGTAIRNCYFNDPVLDYAGEKHASINFCTDLIEHRPKMSQLVRFMRLYSQNQATLASEFGAFVRVVYLRDMDLIMINPTILERSSQVNQCLYANGHQIARSMSTKIAFVSESYEQKQITFSRKDNCLVEAALEVLQ